MLRILIGIILFLTVIIITAVFWTMNKYSTSTEITKSGKKIKEKKIQATPKSLQFRTGFEKYKKTEDSSSFMDRSEFFRNKK